MELLLISISLGMALYILMVLPLIPDSRQAVRVLDRETMERLKELQYRDRWDR